MYAMCKVGFESCQGRTSAQVLELPSVHKGKSFTVALVKSAFRPASKKWCSQSFVELQNVVGAFLDPLPPS